jgi:mannosyltransferase
VSSVSPSTVSPAHGGVGPALAAAIIAALAAFGWVPHLPESLWLDETVTWWVVHGSFSDTLDRAVQYQPHPAYYAGLWGWTQLFGTSEVALRLPSLLAMLAACLLLARVGSALFADRELGWIAAVVFASSWNVFRESTDARAYALGLLVLIALVGSVRRWLEEGGRGPAIACGLLAALLPHLHAFFALAYPALVVHALARWPRSRATGREVAIIALLLAAGALLYLPVAISLADHAGSYSFARRPQPGGLVSMFVWDPAVAGLLVGLCLAGIGSRRSRRGDPVPTPRPDRDTGLLLATWVLFPLLALYGLSVFSETSVFIGRYLSAAMPGVALLYALAVRAIPSAPARVVAVLVVAVAGFVSHERPHDDLRGAAAAVEAFSDGDAEVPVLFASGLIETQHVEWLHDPERAAYLNAPASYYPMGDRVIQLPRKLHGQPLAAKTLDPVFAEAKRFAVVEWLGNGADVLAWLVPEADDRGFRVDRRSYGVVRVAFFNRRSD